MSTRTKILFVDDETELCEIARSSLVHKYEVLTAENGKEAFDMFRKFGPDIVVTDIVMPGVSGLSLATEVKKEMVPVIVFSGHARDSLKIAKNFGADETLEKPLVMKELEEKIDLIMARRREKKVLLVDDNDVDQKALMRYLIPSGFRLFTAFNAKHAQKILGKEPMDLVIINVKGDDADTLDSLKVIRNTFKKTAVIVVTGDERVSSEMIAGLCDAFHVKPVTHNDFLTHVRRQLYKRKQ